MLRNAKVEMFKGSLRLRVDKWGSVEVAEDLDFQPNVRPVAILQRSVALHVARFPGTLTALQCFTRNMEVSAL